MTFKECVYGIVRKIPKGRVMSYKMVARLVGSSRAWRAVGNILAENKNPQISCHRVIKSDGKVGGYNKGAKNKIKLLKEEGIKIKNGKIR